MATTIRPVKVNHMNVVVEDFDGAVARLRTLFDADFFMDIPQAEWHAGLIEFGRIIVELFAPPAFLLNARYGPHYLGIEYQADLDVVRAAIAERGIRIARDIGLAVHTHPADTLGIAFEFYDGEFHARDYPMIGGPLRPAAFWRDVHPLGLTGLVGFTTIVRDLEAGARFLESFLGAARIYEVDRPEAAAQAIGLRVADSTIELLTPTGRGSAQMQLDRFGEGIWSTIVGTRALATAQTTLADRGLILVPGSAAGRLATRPEDCCGIVLEFTES